MKPTGKAARQHRLSAAASEFQPAVGETAVAVADTAAPGEAACGLAASQPAQMDVVMQAEAADGCADEADALGGEELEDGAAGCGGASQADELESEDGRSDRVRMGSAARRCVTAARAGAPPAQWRACGETLEPPCDRALTLASASGTRDGGGW